MIRRAEPKDIDDIFFLYQRYALNVNNVDDPFYIQKVQKEGFTIDLNDRNDLANRIQNSLIFNVFVKTNQILGYIDINKEIYFPEEADNIVWLDKEAKNEYFHGEKSVALHHIVVNPEYKGRGIGRKLLKHSEDELRIKGYKYLFAIITTGPVKNFPSTAFHNKMGFKKVCETKPIDLFGLKNYESELYLKNIS